MTIIEKITDILNDVAKTYNLHIVQVTYAKRILQILVEHPDLSPVTIDECEIASKAFSTSLDVEDVIKERYMLEVSSAGMDRPLVTLDDYIRFVGRKIKLELKMPRNAEDNRKKLKGTITNATNNGTITLLTTLDKQEQSIDLEYSNILKCKLLIDDDFIKQILKQDKQERKK